LRGGASRCLRRPRPNGSSEVPTRAPPNCRPETAKTPRMQPRQEEADRPVSWLPSFNSLETADERRRTPIFAGSIIRVNRRASAVSFLSSNIPAAHQGSAPEERHRAGAAVRGVLPSCSFSLFSAAINPAGSFCMARATVPISTVISRLRIAEKNAMFLYSSVARAEDLYSSR